jgi:hypothetical protein
MSDSEVRPRIEDGQLGAAAERLSRTYGGEEGGVSEEEVRSVLQEAADELRDTPVQSFVPLLAENRARNELQKRKQQTER